MAELIMQKLTQIGLIISSGMLYLLTQVDTTLINEAFDQLFSIGLLVIVVFMLYREWKASQKYNQERDRKLEQLIENNTQALNALRVEVQDLRKDRRDA